MQISCVNHVRDNSKDIESVIDRIVSTYANIQIIFLHKHVDPSQESADPKNPQRRR